MSYRLRRWFDRQICRARRHGLEVWTVRIPGWPPYRCCMRCGDPLP